MEVGAFIKACQDQIDVLKNSINDEETNSTGWLGIQVDKSNADTVAHKHGVVLSLSEKLHSVTSQFDQLRAIRFQEAISRATPRRKFKPITKPSFENPSQLNNFEPREADQFQPEPLKVKQQLLDDETRALQVELTSL
ncbi:syntaxin-81-like [Humulus lupulus]|uniref:syntaxin-81-like n=1 Tax=Humulus lupulus TaxID=3486 RepID=UPI002B417B4B|nr:syntaxin-81-like [Humulus lupulus]